MPQTVSRSSPSLHLSCIIFVLLISVIIDGKAANPRIYGTARGYEGQMARIIISGDLVSGRELVISNTYIDSLGNFSLPYTIPETCFAYLTAGFQRALLFIEPDKELKIIIHDNDTVERDKFKNPFISLPPLNISFISSDENEINHLISKADEVIDSYAFVNFSKPKDIKNKYYLDTLKAITDSAFYKSGNEYLKQYIRYRIALFESSFRSDQKKDIYEKYIKDQPVLSRNPAYAEFFSSFFVNYIFMQSKQISPSALNYTINMVGNVFSLLDSLGRDSLLRNARIREFVLVKNIQQQYHTKKYSQYNIISILQGLQEHSKFREVREAAANALFMVTRLSMGEEAPSFSIEKTDGEILRFKEINNTAICLIFFTTHCDVCNLEMNLVPGIMQKYGEKVRFIGICCDKEDFYLSRYLKERPAYKWEFAYFKGNINLLDDYQVRSYPTFALIMDTGKIAASPARLPSKGLDRQISMFVRK